MTMGKSPASFHRFICFGVLLWEYMKTSIEIIATPTSVNGIAYNAARSFKLADKYIKPETIRILPSAMKILLLILAILLFPDLL